jgi:hypothetical protein
VITSDAKAVAGFCVAIAHQPLDQVGRETLSSGNLSEPMLLVRKDVQELIGLHHGPSDPSEWKAVKMLLSYSGADTWARARIQQVMTRRGNYSVV